MDEQTVVYPRNEIKKKAASKTWKDMRNLKCSLLSKRNQYKRLHTIRFQLNDILKKTRIWKQ